MLLELLCSGLAAVCPQDPAPRLPPSTTDLTRRLPGATPGTERWILLLRDGAIPRDEMRAALASASPAGTAQLEQRIAAAQAGLVRDLQARGARVTAQWWLVNGLAVEVEPAQVAALRADPRVAFVHPDLARSPGIRRATDPKNHATDHLHRLGIRGRGAVVAIVDSGVDADMGGLQRPHATFYPHGDVNDRSGGGIAGSRLLANVQVGKQPAEDPITHGTSVAAIAAGARWNQTPVADDGHAPDAQIVSYSVADLPNGYTTAQTLTNAWQRVAADAAARRITVANCSYEGYAEPRFSDQLAIDVLAETTGVLVTGMAGNGGASSEYAYGATNMIAVGAVHPDTRAVASFSSRGPLLGEPQRGYPDLVANGVDVVLPVADAEAGSRTAQGTSYSAPQVAGLAALLRSLRPAWSAPMVKAALVATAQDVSAQNPTPPYNSRNAYGAGYPRAPALQQLASGLGVVQSGSVQVATPFTLPLDVTAQSAWTIAITWFRRAESTIDWSDLDLEVLDGTTVVAASKSLRTPLEFVRFRAPSTGTLTLRVTAKQLQSAMTSQSFGIAAFADDGLGSPGLFTLFGTECAAQSHRINLQPEPGVPRIGAGYTLLATQVGQFPPNPMLLLTGFSDRNWGPFLLPFDLTPLGAPGCKVLTSTDLVSSIPIHTGGPSRVTIHVPNLAGLIGLDLFHQAITSTQFNAMGVVLSGGVRVLIGG